MKVATKQELRDKVITLNNKLKASKFTLELSTAALTSERELRSQLQIVADLATGEVKVLKYAIRHLEENQK